MYLSFTQALSELVADYGIIGAIVIVAVGIIYYFFGSSSGQPEYNGPMMRQEDVLKMIKNYREHHLPEIHGGTYFDGIKDAYSVRFDLDQLKEFIIKVEKSQTGQNQTLGVRFYYAAYSGGVPIHDGYDCSKCHTLVMVPTRLVDEEHMDFNANNPNSREFLIDNHYLDSPSNSDTHISALNKGSLFPPMD